MSARSHGLATGACNVEDCEAKAHSKGLCSKHYSRWARTGDVNTVRSTHPAEKLSMTYAAVHLRLKREQGPAANHACACGAPAEQWAYDHNDPDEVFGDTGAGKWQVWYSVDLNHYLPLCRACHTTLDAPDRSKVCRNGHTRTPENTRIKTNGTRVCRICVRASRSAGYFRRKAERNTPTPPAKTDGGDA